MKKAFAAAVVALVLAATMALAGCQADTAADQGAIKSDLAGKLDAAKDGNVPGLDELLKGNELVKDLGLDVSKLVDAYTNGFSYEIGNIKVDESAGTATAEVKLTIKSPDEIAATWASSLGSDAASLSISSLSSSEMASTLGDSLLEAIETAAPVNVQTVSFSYTKASDGTWQMDDPAKQVYQALGLDSFGNIANLLCKQLGLSDVTDLGAQVLRSLL